jgi:tetratricopeptide (TPR) repeat protein
MRLAALALFVIASSANAVNAPTIAVCETAYSELEAKNYRSTLRQLELCTANLQIDALTRSRYHLGRAWALYELGRLNEAIAEQEKAFVLPAPPYRLQFTNYATMLRSAGRLRESLSAIERAEQIDKSEGKGPSMMVQYHKGKTLQKMGRHREAIEAFTTGIPDQADFPFVYWRRAISYTSIANRAAAVADMRRFSDLFTVEWRKHCSAQELSQYRKQVLGYGLTPGW